MDFFEAIVARILAEQGYWVRQGVRVELSKETKRALGRPSLPRPEIDLVAYKPDQGELVLFEVKSYLDSLGVQPEHLHATDWEDNRYKLLTIPGYQQVVGEAVLQAYRQQGLVVGEINLKFGLAAGFVQERYTGEVTAIAANKGWDYWSPQRIADALRALAAVGYENSPIVLTAKMLERNPAR